MAKVNLTARLEGDCVAYLDELAEFDGRDRSYLIQEAIDSYIRHRRWRVDEVKRAVAEAEAGDFASDGNVHAVFRALTR